VTLASVRYYSALACRNNFSVIPSLFAAIFAGFLSACYCRDCGCV
jgi:hypothetical protein